MPAEFELDRVGRVVRSRAWGDLTEDDLFTTCAEHARALREPNAGFHVGSGVRHERHH